MNSHNLVAESHVHWQVRARIARSVGRTGQDDGDFLMSFFEGKAVGGLQRS